MTIGERRDSQAPGESDHRAEKGKEEGLRPEKKEKLWGKGIRGGITSSKGVSAKGQG